MLKSHIRSCPSTYTHQEIIFIEFTNDALCWMMLYSFIVISVSLQYRIASYCNYHNEHFQCHPIGPMYV